MTTKSRRWNDAVVDVVGRSGDFEDHVLVRTVTGAVKVLGMVPGEREQEHVASGVELIAQWQFVLGSAVRRIGRVHADDVTGEFVLAVRVFFGSVRGETCRRS